MPRAEFRFPPRDKRDPPLLVVVNPRDRRGDIRVEAMQGAESAFIDMPADLWLKVFGAIFANALEKKP